MLMFGSMSGGKSDASSTSNLTGKSALKEARSKEGADQGAMGPDPYNSNVTLREMSHHRSLSSPQNTRDHFALLFRVQVTPLLGNVTDWPVLLLYVWSKQIIMDTLRSSIDGMSQVIVLNSADSFVFKGCCS